MTRALKIVLGIQIALGVVWTLAGAMAHGAGGLAAVGVFLLWPEPADEPPAREAAAHTLRHLAEDAPPDGIREAVIEKDRAQAHLVLGFRGTHVADPDRHVHILLQEPDEAVGQPQIKPQGRVARRDPRQNDHKGGTSCSRALCRHLSLRFRTESWTSTR